MPDPHQKEKTNLEESQNQKKQEKTKKLRFGRSSAGHLSGQDLPNIVCVFVFLFFLVLVRLPELITFFGFSKQIFVFSWISTVFLSEIWFLILFLWFF